MEKIHTSGITVKSDGSVFIPDARGNYRWTFGSLRPTGYRYVTYQKKSYAVHRLVAETYLANPENKPTVDHINRIRDDNSVDNLRWATMKEQRENAADVLFPDRDISVRCIENPKEYHRQLCNLLYKENPVAHNKRTRKYRDKNRDKINLKSKSYRERKIAEGFKQVRNLDGHRRWVKVEQ